MKINYLMEGIREGFSLAYCLGEFTAAVMLSGIFHPDMKRSNIGYTVWNGFKFVDYAEIKFFSMPEDLNKDMMYKLWIQHRSITRDIPEDFFTQSNFRAGFVARGGVFGRLFYLYMTKFGFSCFKFTSDDINTLGAGEYATLQLQRDEIKNAIMEWKNLSTEEYMPNHYTLLEYVGLPIRKSISYQNVYFLDRLFLTRSLCKFYSDNDCFNKAIVLLNLGKIAMTTNYHFIAYGLLKKCLMLSAEYSAINRAGKILFNKLSENLRIPVRSKEYIDKILCYDEFSLLWMLEELQFSGNDRGKIA